jgi:hypothetical protein
MRHGGSTDMRVFSLNLPPPPREASIVMPPAATKTHTANEPEIESRARLRSSPHARGVNRDSRLVFDSQADFRLRSTNFFESHARGLRDA